METGAFSSTYSAVALNAYIKRGEAFILKDAQTRAFKPIVTDRPQGA